MEASSYSQQIADATILTVNTENPGDDNPRTVRLNGVDLIDQTIRSNKREKWKQLAKTLDLEEAYKNDKNFRKNFARYAKSAKNRLQKEADELGQAPPPPQNPVQMTPAPKKSTAVPVEPGFQTPGAAFGNPQALLTFQDVLTKFDERDAKAAEREAKAADERSELRGQLSKAADERSEIRQMALQASSLAETNRKEMQDLKKNQEDLQAIVLFQEKAKKSTKKSYLWIIVVVLLFLGFIMPTPPSEFWVCTTE